MSVFHSSNKLIQIPQFKFDNSQERRMINLTKVDTKALIQPNIIMFASPSITPSHNFKGQAQQKQCYSHSIITKDLNSSQIHGRKVDSPQLRVMKDQLERPQPASNSISYGSQIKRDDLFSHYNYQTQLHELNQTNKDFQKKPFDLNINKGKGHVTIYHEDKSATGTQAGPKHHKGSKSMAISQKRRQQSQSMPRHQPSASIVNTQAQPLINLHIQNAKMAGQAKAVNQMVQKKRQAQHENAKHNTNPSHARSKSKQRQKSMQQRMSLNAHTAKDTLNQSHNIGAKKSMKNQFLFSFDNKENQSINHNEFSPSRIEGKFNFKKNNFLDSDSSSISSPKAPPEAIIAHKMEKQYFMDKSTLLKHLSPERQLSKSKTRMTQDVSQLMQPQILSDRAKPESANYKSNLSTLVHKQPLYDSMANVSKGHNSGLIDKSQLKFKLKRAGTSGGVATNKLKLKGVDKIIKENLKKVKTKEEEQITKRQIEEFKQKIKKMELSQRNQQVRKINASKILHNYKKQENAPNAAQRALNASSIGYKKHRSKSCMNQTDSIFGGMNGPRSKERLPQNKLELNPQVQPIAETKKEKKREKSFVHELRELQKQIDGEIRREIKAGKLEIQPFSAANKRTNLSTINVKKETSQPKVKNQLNMSVIDPVNITYKQRDHSKENNEASHQNLKVRRKSKSKDTTNNNKSISQNIKRFIEKKKNVQAQMKSLEQTIEQKKQFKMKENLKSLNQYVKQHFRHQSHGINLKKNQSSNQHILDHHESHPLQNRQSIIKRLKPQFLKHKGKKKQSKKVFEFHGEPIFNDEGDISKDVYEDYQNLLKSIQKHHNQRVRDLSTSSIEASVNKNRSSSKKRAKGKKKSVPTMGLKDELELTANLKKALKESHGIQLPVVVPEKGATLIPPQSDIATINRDNFDRSQHRVLDQSTEKKRQYQDSAKASTKSPKQIAKISQLIQRYGHILPPSQMHGPSADTKLLIKLHSAAITIQQNFRRHLQNRGFYEDEDDNSSQNSQMYVDSDEEDGHQYRFDEVSAKKQYDEVARQLIAQTSPLRVKKQAQDYQPKTQLPSATQGNKFYSEDSSDMEKVIVCSVITSARVEGDESLQNTQKYVPLRQKVQPQPKRQPVASSSSSAQTAFNTAIKTQVPPLQQRLQDSNMGQDLQLSSSQRKKVVPSLDFTRLGPAKEEEKTQIPKMLKPQDEENKESSNTSRSIFERNSFQNFSQKIGTTEQFNMNNYPEMLKMREDAIKYREQEEQKLLKKMFKSNQMSPRTYDIKRKELETWVTKEKEEVKKTKRVFEEQWKKTAQIIEWTQKNHDFMKRVLTDNTHQAYGMNTFHQKTSESIPSEQTQQAMLSSHRQGTLNSKRDDTTHILDKIQDYNFENKPEQPQMKLQAQELPQKSDRQHQQREQEKQREIERKKEIERLKEQERLEQERQKEIERQQELERQKQKQKEEEERQRKAAEEKRLAEEKRIADEKKRKKIEEEQRKKREEELRKQKEQEELQRKQDEIKRKAEEERKRIELDKKQQQELEQRKKAEQEEAERQRKLKQEEEDQKERERLAKEREIERQRLEREAREKREKERQLAKEKQERDKLEMERKLAAVQKKFEDQSKSKGQEGKKEDMTKKVVEEVKQEVPKVQPQKSGQSKYHNDDDHNLDSDDYSDDFDFSHQKDTQLLHQELFLDQGKKVKEVLESLEDKKSSEEEQKHQVSSHLQSFEDPVKDDDAGRGLSRTRSSQYLNDNRVGEDDLLDEEVPSQSLLNKPSLNNLNDESMDEDLIAKKLLERQARNEDITKALKDEGFFTKDFDTKDASDVISGLRASDDRTKETTVDVPLSTPTNEVQVPSNNKILVQDEAEEESKDQISTGTFILDDRRNPRLSQDMRNQIPVENEQYFNPGMPVSPVSLNGDLRIQTGAQSLESTLTEVNELNNVLHEVNQPQNKQNELDLQADKITDDIFRQLMAELRVDLDILILTDPRKLFKDEPQNQLLSESGRFLIFERRGIKTDLFAIEKYVEEVLDEVLKQRVEFMDNIQKPLTKNPREVLNQLQNSEIGSYDHFETTFPPVLSLDLYLKLEKRRKQQRELDNQQTPQQTSPGIDRNFLAECEHIHNKVLFDCINDSLLQFKPYGKDGSPLPWSRQNRRLKPIEEFTVEEMFEIVKHDLFRWAIMQAGTLPRREFVFNGLFDDELFAEIREKKLATLLAREMIETEPKWLNYEFEEAQVKIDIGDMILEQLVTETISILKQNAGIQ